MNVQTILIAAVVGYLAGSISFARLVTRLVSPDGELGGVTIMAPGSDVRIVLRSVSATTVRLQLGSKYGFLVSILDMIKVAAPALAFKLWLPEPFLYLVSAGMGVVGHIWPLYHRFRGGRGLSAILGGFLVVDWLGVLVTNVLGMLLGLPFRSFLIMTSAGILLMIPWLWLRSGAWELVVYAIVVDLFYLVALIPELKEHAELYRSGQLEPLETARELRVIRADGSETIDRATVNNLIEKISSWFK